MKMTIKLLVSSALTISLAACESESLENLQEGLAGNIVDSSEIEQILSINAGSQAVGTPTVFSNYDPSSGVASDVPSAIDLLFVDSLDSTLNIPIEEDANGNIIDPQAPVKAALNALDGFSTVTPITVGFTGEVDPATLGPSPTSPTTPQAVRMFEVQLTQPGAAVLSIEKELAWGTDFIASPSSLDPTGATLAVVPLRPLKPKTSYYVVVTNNLKDTLGNSVGASPVYTLAKVRDTSYVAENGASTLAGFSDEDAALLEQLRRLITFSEFTVDFALEDLAAVNIVVSWSFTTQSVGDVLTVVRGLAQASSPATDLNASTAIVGAAGAGRSPLGAANMFEGTIDLPYYLAAPSATDPTANLTKPWQAANTVGGENNLTSLNPLPVATATVTVPLLITTPVDTATFPAPWKTVIFQHGITSNRTVMLGVADSLAQAGFAVIAIDMPLHGVDNSSPFYQAGKERTFEVDFLTEGGLVAIPSPDGNTDSSGAHYVNLSNLVVTRDNLRQSVADLFALTSAVATIDVDRDSTPDLDANNIYFIGHSLGAIVGTTFTALETRIKDAVFAMGGGYITKILDGSAAFSPSLVAGLTAASGGLIDKTGTNGPLARAAYESFLGVAQTVIDSADPVNYTTAAATGRGILFFEIVGDGTPGTSDLVVPNTVPDGNDTSDTVAAPLAGTEPMLTLMGLTQVNSSQTGSDLKLSVKFTSGDHSSILSPAADAAVTAEMQAELASFLASDGAAVTVTNVSVIQTPAP